MANTQDLSRHCVRARIAFLCVCFLFAVGIVGPGAHAGGNPNSCDAEGDIPDVIVGDLHQINKNGTVGNITAYSVGTYSCNVGTCWLDWFQLPNPRHPQIGGNIYRMKDGRFEHLGQGWLKQGFFALSNTLCNSGCLGTNGQHLGVHCADPYSAGLNGQQNNLGPKDAVNASTGILTVPVRNINLTGNAIFKRIQVKNEDIDPSLNPGAQYFVEGMYLFPDDAPIPDTDDDATPGDGVDDFDQVDNSANNSSYRPLTFSPGSFNPSFSGPTIRSRPAIYAWAHADLGVHIVDVVVPGDGRYWVASRATDLKNGLWHYEYAVLNHTSDRSARAFSVPVPLHANFSNFGFHDVDYHSENQDGSGSYYDGTDWVHSDGTDGNVTFSTVETFEENEFANALRWNTLYNFRFDSDAPPAAELAEATIKLFKPGTPNSVTVEIVGPTVCDLDGACESGENDGNCPADCVDQGGGGGFCGNDVCDAGETSCTCTRDCGAAPVTEFQCGDGVDDDCDGLNDCADSDCCFDGLCAGPDVDGDGFELCDCDDSNPNVWSRPGPVEDFVLSGNELGTTLEWTPVFDPGATAVTYEVLRSGNAANLVGSTTCVPDGDPTDTMLFDPTGPLGGEGFFYDIRAVNACPNGEGPLGRDSNNIPREGRSCP